MKDFERAIVTKVLRRYGGNCNRAAKHMGMNRNTLVATRVRLGLPVGSASGPFSNQPTPVEEAPMRTGTLEEYLAFVAKMNAEKGAE